MKAMVRLWRNECERVFADRLVDEKDRNLVVGELIPNIIKEMFGD